jgi:hypothetical protein
MVLSYDCDLTTNDAVVVLTMNEAGDLERSLMLELVTWWTSLFNSRIIYLVSVAQRNKIM